MREGRVDAGEALATGLWGGVHCSRRDKKSGRKRNKRRHSSNHGYPHRREMPSKASLRVRALSIRKNEREPAELRRGALCWILVFHVSPSPTCVISHYHPFRMALLRPIIGTLPFSEGSKKGKRSLFPLPFSYTVNIQPDIHLLTFVTGCSHIPLLSK